MRTLRFKWSTGLFIACFCSFIMWAGYAIEQWLVPERFKRPVVTVNFVRPRPPLFKTGHGWFKKGFAGITAQYADPLYI